MLGNINTSLKLKLPTKPRGGLFLSASENCGHHARAAPSVHHCDNPKRPLIGSVGDQVIPDQFEAKRAAREFRSEKATMRELSRQFELGKELAKQP